MNFNEELALVGELELTDSELETVSGGWWRRHHDYDEYPYYYYPRYYYPRPWWGEGDWGWGGGDWDGEGHHHEGGEGHHHEGHDIIRAVIR